MAYIGIICHKHDAVNTKERRDTDRDRDFGVHTMLIICHPVVLFIVCRSLFNKSAVAGIRIRPPLRSAAQMATYNTPVCYLSVFAVVIFFRT